MSSGICVTLNKDKGKPTSFAFQWVLFTLAIVYQNIDKYNKFREKLDRRTRWRTIFLGDNFCCEQFSHDSRTIVPRTVFPRTNSAANNSPDTYCTFHITCCFTFIRVDEYLLYIAKMNENSLSFLSLKNIQRI